MSFSFRLPDGTLVPAAGEAWEKLWQEMQEADLNEEEPDPAQFMTAFPDAASLEPVEPVRVQEVLEEWKKSGSSLQALVYASMEEQAQPTVPNTSPPKFGEICLNLFVPPEEQEEKLGDFEERFRKAWVPKYGVFFGRCFYLWHVVLVAAHFLRVSVLTAVLAWVFHRFSL